MSYNNSDRSYRRYRQYKDNQRRYKTSQVTFPIAMLIIIGIVSEFWWIFAVIIGGLILYKVFTCVESKKKIKEDISVSAAKEVVGMTTVVGENRNMKTTEVGYINKNNQKNKGCTSEMGTDHNQYFYEMECLNCGKIYLANGSDIWQRKCPKCQGGKQ